MKKNSQHGGAEVYHLGRDCHDAAGDGGTRRFNRAMSSSCSRPQSQLSQLVSTNINWQRPTCSRYAGRSAANPGSVIAAVNATRSTLVHESGQVSTTPLW